jgi:hypothetical protein
MFIIIEGCFFFSRKEAKAFVRFAELPRKVTLSRKEENHQQCSYHLRVFLLFQKRSKSVCPLRGVASQSYAFCFFFWKKKKVINDKTLEGVSSLQKRLLRGDSSQSYAFCFFFWKKKKTKRRKRGYTGDGNSG